MLCYNFFNLQLTCDVFVMWKPSVNILQTQSCSNPFEHISCGLGGSLGFQWGNFFFLWNIENWNVLVLFVHIKFTCFHMFFGLIYLYFFKFCFLPPICESAIKRPLHKQNAYNIFSLFLFFCELDPHQDSHWECSKHCTSLVQKKFNHLYDPNSYNLCYMIFVIYDKSSMFVIQ